MFPITYSSLNTASKSSLLIFSEFLFPLNACISSCIISNLSEGNIFLNVASNTVAVTLPALLGSAILYTLMAFMFLAANSFAKYLTSLSQRVRGDIRSTSGIIFFISSEVSVVDSLVPAKLTQEARTVMMSCTMAKPSESRGKDWKA